MPTDTCSHSHHLTREMTQDISMKHSSVCSFNSSSIIADKNSWIWKLGASVVALEDLWGSPSLARLQPIAARNENYRPIFCQDRSEPANTSGNCPGNDKALYGFIFTHDLNNIRNIYNYYRHHYNAIQLPIDLVWTVISISLMTVYQCDVNGPSATVWWENVMSCRVVRDARQRQNDASTKGIISASVFVGSAHWLQSDERMW